MSAPEINAVAAAAEPSGSVAESSVASGSAVAPAVASAVADDASAFPAASTLAEGAAVEASAVEPPAVAPDAGSQLTSAKLDCEKMVVYQVALELQVLCATLVPAQQRVLKDQLERASLSVVCNVAEAAGRRSRKDKRRVYTIARGSATETAAIIDVLRLRHLASEAQCRTARSHAVRVVQLLTKLHAALA